MALAVCVLFDRGGDRLVRNLWARLEADGVGTLLSHTHGRHRPHLSYAVLLEWDVDAVTKALAGLPDGEPFDLSCQGALTFPRGRVALAPSLPGSAMLRQEAVIRALESTGAVVHRHYLPGHWVPHVSAATRATRGQLPAVVKAVNDMVPMVLTAERAGLVDTATGRLVPLPALP